MTTYQIGYAPNRPRGAEHCSELIAAIKDLADGWCNCLDSTWIVMSNLDHVAIRGRLRPYINSGDVLLVAGLTGRGAWSGFSE